MSFILLLCYILYAICLVALCILTPCLVVACVRLIFGYKIPTSVQNIWNRIKQEFNRDH